MAEYDSYAEKISALPALQPLPADFDDPLTREADPALILQLREILLAGMGIVREEEGMQKALDQVLALKEEAEKDLQGQKTGRNLRDKNRIHLAEAMLRSALARRESRGAHYRSDYPEKDEEYRKTAVAEWKDGRACITYRPLPERRSAGR
jgi:succinate dehydrogenase/fumarate reductase flavoprotein subunit